MVLSFESLVLKRWSANETVQTIVYNWDAIKGIGEEKEENKTVRVAKSSVDTLVYLMYILIRERI